VADLEALTGHAVVLEDSTLFEHWNVPEAYGSAVCVPVSSPDTLLGTLWLFASEAREYDDRETQLLEIIAGRLAAELERRVLLTEAAQNRESREQAAHVSTWHEERCRPAAPVVDGWQIAGTTVNSGRSRGDFHLWRVDDRDQLWLTSAAITGPATKSMLTSTLLQGAVQTILQRPCEPIRMVEHLNEVLWSSSTSGEAASFFCGTLDPETGKLQFATAGSTDAYILRPHGWQPIVVDALPLGHDTRWQGACHVQEIQPGDILMIVSDRHLARSEHPTDLCTTALAEALLHHMHLSAKDLAGLAAHLISKQCPDPWARSILIAKRSELAGDSLGKLPRPQSP
jgi:serine phosphatase RsbU (regulator of sigma subunit)